MRFILHWLKSTSGWVEKLWKVHSNLGQKRDLKVSISLLAEVAAGSMLHLPSKIYLNS